MDKYVVQAPQERSMEVYKGELKKSEEKVTKILGNVTVFSALAEEQLKVMAYSMTRRVYDKGDLIIKQDELGDAFFILEFGEVSVTRKKNPSDPNEVAKELIRLGDKSHFGEMALITDELRSATITVTSQVAHCLVMTKEAFDICMVINRKIAADSMRLIGQQVISIMPLFQSMSKFNRKGVLDALVPMTFSSNTYICREGAEGQTFYIITTGTVRVTTNVENSDEKEVARLGTGDFFGEMALMSTEKLRTANCIANGKVTCMTLSSTDFHRLLRSQQEHLGGSFASKAGEYTHSGGKNDENTKTNDGHYHRRITGFDLNNRPNSTLTSGLFLGLARCMYEAMWTSMYWKLYRRLLLDPSLGAKLGPLTETVLDDVKGRHLSVNAIQDRLIECLEISPDQRSDDEVWYIYGILSTQNDFIRAHCKGWSEKQLMELARLVGFRRVSTLKPLWRVNDRCSSAYLILKGSVRMFKGVRSAHTGNFSNVYQEERVSGEIIGEAVLEGMSTRLFTAMSVTQVDFLVIQEDDYLAVQGHVLAKLSVQERFEFLRSMSIFSKWDTYKLYAVAQVLQQKDMASRARVFQIGIPANKLAFVLTGTVDVISAVNHRNAIAQLLPGDCLGESSVLNFFDNAKINVKKNLRKNLKGKAHKQNEWTEENYFMTGVGVQILSMDPSHFGLFDLLTVKKFEDEYILRRAWRGGREADSLKEAAVFRGLVRATKVIGAQLSGGVELDIDDQLDLFGNKGGNDVDDATSVGGGTSLSDAVPYMPGASVSVSSSAISLDGISHTSAMTIGSVATIRKETMYRREKKFALDIMNMTSSLDDDVDPIFAMNTVKTKKAKESVSSGFKYSQQYKIRRNARNTLKEEIPPPGMLPPLTRHISSNDSVGEMSSLGSIGGQTMNSFSAMSLMMDTRKIS